MRQERAMLVRLPEKACIGKKTRMKLISSSKFNYDFRKEAKGKSDSRTHIQARMHETRNEKSLDESAFLY